MTWPIKVFINVVSMIERSDAFLSCQGISLKCANVLFMNIWYYVMMFGTGIFAIYFGLDSKKSEWLPAKARGIGLIIVGTIAVLLSSLEFIFRSIT
jgi:heme/copper-type cytochrome/quinol oxidase subunit 3